MTDRTKAAAQHTPESWEVIYCGKRYEIGTRDEEPVIVAECWDEKIARLIAAAPEMVEACQKALKVFQSMTYTDHSDEWAAGEAQELIEAALAKARGE